MRRTIDFLLLMAALLPAAFASEVFSGGQVAEIIRLRLDRDELLLESIQDTIKKHKIEDGAVLTAAGTLQVCTFHAVANMNASPEDKMMTRQGPLEILGLNGIIAGGEPHLHMTLGNNQGQTTGGHIEPGCKVLYRAEITIARFSGPKVARLPNKDGVPMMQRVPAAKGSTKK
jgi:predicted DNA-binding protein with PD1-like motif